MSSIFSKIIAGELPGHFVWQDDHAVAIMTIESIVPGHLLVIPRQEVDHWDDLSESLSNHLMAVSKRLAKALKQVYQCKRVSLQIVGLEVPHVHLHLVPVNDMTDCFFGNAKGASAEELAAEAARIREALA